MFKLVPVKSSSSKKKKSSRRNKYESSSSEESSSESSSSSESETSEEESDNGSKMFKINGNRVIVKEVILKKPSVSEPKPTPVQTDESPDDPDIVNLPIPASLLDCQKPVTYMVTITPETQPPPSSMLPPQDAQVQYVPVCFPQAQYNQIKGQLTGFVPSSQFSQMETAQQPDSQPAPQHAVQPVIHHIPHYAPHQLQHPAAHPAAQPVVQPAAQPATQPHPNYCYIPGYATYPQ